ncbi:MAG: nuclear transport factor 2 family protein [Candidatus Aminicenantes bacterium]|nr:MAG: nuclear transport factor 2 family protein [Candidatus Aminicenantes bacterium]
MKKIILLFIILIVLIFSIFVLADSDIENEKAAIKNATLDYLEGWYDGDAVRMERALHPEFFTKRGILIHPNTGEMATPHLNAEMMIGYVKQGGGKSFPREKLKNEVIILDIYKNTASVKAISAQFVDYLHLAKFDGKWMIVNILWELKTE